MRYLLLALLACGSAAIAAEDTSPESPFNNTANQPAVSPFFGTGGEESGQGFTRVEHKLPVSATFFKGEALPVPPQQTAPWTPATNDAYTKAAETLFNQGMADPRGLDYREIEVVVGDPWGGGGGTFKTHGWVLPAKGAGSFAVTWNGLVYPTLKVGALASVEEDWAPGSKAAKYGERSEGGDAHTVTHEAQSELRRLMLLRLGKTEIVARVFTRKRLNWQDEDPYLDLAKDWTACIFERAVCAHIRGDDRLAMVDARLLTRVYPLIEAEAKRRGYRDEHDGNGRNHVPHIYFLRQLPELLADSERRVAQQKAPAPPKIGIAALIEDLQNVGALQTGQPGGVSLLGDPRVEALVKLGGAAVEPLLAAMESDTRLTRTVSFGRDFAVTRTLYSVADAAYSALLETMMQQRAFFSARNDQGEYFTRQQMAAQMAAYWARLGSLSPAERAYKILNDDTAGTERWLAAAADIVHPEKTASPFGLVRIPQRKVRRKIKSNSGVLRDRRAPSVAELMAKRSAEFAAAALLASSPNRTSGFGFGSPALPANPFVAGEPAAPTGITFRPGATEQMALYLAEWDPAAALPVLKRLLQQVWGNGTDVARNKSFGYSTGFVPHLTLARARSGDATVYDEYSLWIRAVATNGGTLTEDALLLPLIEGAARPSIQRAIDFLLTDPTSPWFDIFAPANTYLVRPFWESPLPLSAAFIPRATLALTDRSPAGIMSFPPVDPQRFPPPNPRIKRREVYFWLTGQGALDYRGANVDKDLPPPGEKREFRVCDLYAYYYSREQNGPPFQLFWPEKKRDAGVEACRKWLAAKA